MPFLPVPLFHSLRGKLLFLHTLIACLFVLAQLFIFYAFIYPSYVNLEQHKARTDLERCITALNREVHHLDQFTNDWASWDDSYFFIVNPNQDYIQSNLQLSSFVDNEITLIYYVRNDGKVIWGRAMDLKTGHFMTIPEFTGDKWPQNHPLLLHGKETRHGLFMSGIGPLLVAARPVLHSDHSGPSVGTLIMGRLLSDKLVNILRKQTLVDLSIAPLSSPPNNIPDAVIKRVQQTPKPVFLERGDTLVANARYDDLMKQPALLIQAKVPRDITKQGVKTLFLASVIAVLSACAVILLLLIILNRLIVRPISNLTKHVVTIRNTGELQILPQPRGEDEIDTLTREINGFIRQLKSYHERLRGLSDELLAAEESERRKFARDLHDRIGQSLTMAKIRIDGAASRSQACREELADIGESLSRLIQEARILTFEMSPPMLYEIGLCAALEWLTETFQEQYNLQIETRCTDLPDTLPSAFSVLIFQIFRELLINVIKHAQADRVQLEIWSVGSTIKAKIIDNGIGMDQDPNRTKNGMYKGYGLFSIYERIHHFGGSMHFKTQPGKGMQVYFEIPVEDPLTFSKKGTNQ